MIKLLEFNKSKDEKSEVKFTELQNGESACISNHSIYLRTVTSISEYCLSFFISDRFPNIE